MDDPLACSALNAEQLRRENGLEALAEAFNRCVSVLGQSSKADDLAVQVCLHVCRCLSTAAQFEGCREKLSQMPQVFSDVCHVLYFKHLVKLCCVAAECARSFSVCTILQLHLFQSGVLWYLIPNLFQYDFTLDEGGVEKSEEHNQQELQNRLARISCEACAALAGYREDSPDNDGVQNSLRAMLTPYVNRLMRDSPVDFILKLLNSNTENPYLIWDNGTRVELLEFVEAQRCATTKTSELHGAEFVFTAHKNELVIGEIFIRVYNEQPNFILENPKAFCIELLDFLSKKAQYMHSLNSLTTSANSNSVRNEDSAVERFKDLEMALEALRNVLKADPGLEIQCIGHFKLLFAYLRVDRLPRIQLCTLEVISLASANQECVSDIAASNTLICLFLVLHTVPKGAQTVLSILFTLSSNGKIVRDALELGGLMYILDLLCNSDDSESRIRAAEVLGKFQTDKLTGPRWTRAILKFLPPIFTEAIRDSASGCVQLFDSTTENPELIWNDKTRDKVKKLVAEQAEELYQKQKDNPDFTWKVSENVPCAYEDVVSGEFVVGGVFLRLFIANPSWVLRQPRNFFTELLERTLTEMRVVKPNGDILETLSTALVALLHNNPSMTDLVATQGYIPQIIDVMKSDDPAVARGCVLLFQELTKNETCVDSLSHIECIPGIMAVMRIRKDLLHSASRGLRALFEKDNIPLVAQALKFHLIDFLLKLLGSPLVEVDNSPAVKAEIVNTLKSMTVNLEYGGKITDILNASRIWSEFRDQKHDLFLANTPQIGYLTAGAGAAGYLTQGLSYNQPHTVPPP